ncbi:MAG TPA: CBS domain-containing protein [Candidatus Saccharimonadales bacterium]|nr:CBS domain-containing protein [Candidatus Saccharimonadales bacterium]
MTSNTMSGRNVPPDVKVEDVMSNPVITIKNNDTVLTAAKLMKKHKIGCVVVVDKSGKPHGLITERDIVRRVTALDLVPSKIQAAKSMTKPPVVIDASANVTDAAKKMRQLKVRRLIVITNNKLAGIVTSNDIVDITPSLIDVVTEKSQISPVEKIKETEPLSGYCDRCGSWADELKTRDGQFICDDCSADTEEASQEEED